MSAGCCGIRHGRGTGDGECRADVDFAGYSNFPSLTFEDFLDHRQADARAFDIDCVHAVAEMAENAIGVFAQNRFRCPRR